MTDLKRATREKVVQVRLTAKGVASLDQVRGSWTRSEYIRRALTHAAKSGLKGPEEPEWGEET